MLLFIFNRSTAGAWIAENQHMIVIAESLEEAWQYLENSLTLKDEYLRQAYDLKEEIKITPGIVRQIGY